MGAEGPSIPITELEPVMRIMNGFCHEIDQEMMADGISAGHRASLIGRATKRFIATVGKAYSQAKEKHPEELAAGDASA